MIVSILGCGWYGKALAETLLKNDVTVKGSATSAEQLVLLSDAGIIPYLVRFNGSTEQYDREFFSCDVLVISIPPKARQGEGGEYLAKVKKIVSAIVGYQILKVIYISSTGVYGDCNCGVTEKDTPEPDSESGRILLAAETMLRDQTAFNATIIRFAGLVGPGRHPGRFFAGKTDVPNGLAPVNLIHLDDCVGVTLAVIKQQAFGYTINAASPDHPSRINFYSNATRQAELIVPEFIDELLGWKIVGSVRLTEVLNYSFKVVSWQYFAFAGQVN